MKQEKRYRSGLIPYVIKDGEIKMMFMRPNITTYCGAKFQISKGKQEHGESPKQTALREGAEELGFIPENIKTELVEIGTHLGRTTFYICEVLYTDMFGETTDETAATSWMTESEFLKFGRKLHHPIVSRAIDVIKNGI
jgi:8-oxo-dGTP pyrophosphatase MutT (NUDIX family)